MKVFLGHIDDCETSEKMDWICDNINQDDYQVLIGGPWMEYYYATLNVNAQALIFMLKYSSI